MLANLVGSGTLSASMVGTVWLAADLVWSGSVVAGLKMFAWMVADLNGSGTLEGTMKWWANMSADIYVNQSEASVQQIVSGVWNAIATEYNTSWTMGEAVQTGGGGGGGGGGWATAAQIWSYASRTLTESAGLTTEQAEQLTRVDERVDIKSSDIRAGGGGGFSSQAIQTSISNAKREIIEKMEEIPTKIPQVSLEKVEESLNEIVSQNDIAKTEIIDTIKASENEVCSDIIRKSKELKEDNVKTRNLVRKKTEKINKKLDIEEGDNKEWEEILEILKEMKEESDDKDILDFLDQTEAEDIETLLT